jgi:hypothetical protein
MSKIRVQIITRKQDTFPKNFIVNTVYFDDFNIDPTGGTNWQAFATDVRNLWRTRFQLPATYGVETKVYDQADAKPRPVKASAPWVVGDSSSVEHAPREVALCLSYYSERNLPRFRGRLYIGPFISAQMLPSQSHIDGVKALATGLAGIGGPDVDWGLWSPTRNAFSKITHGWVDNEWDTVRSRGLTASSRSLYTTNE